MAKEWDVKVAAGIEFWIMRKSADSDEYCVMRKPSGRDGDGEAIRYFTAESINQAIQKGWEIAKQYTLL
ncbi:MAG: hypothetical protein ABFD08_08170 [Syntrophomonas sp.]